jgi:hypothetical protein
VQKTVTLSYTDLSSVKIDAPGVGPMEVRAVLLICADQLLAREMAAHAARAMEDRQLVRNLGLGDGRR